MKKIIVIGGGPAGYPAALKAASLGADVTLIEKNKLGGVCLNCGCIPSKSFLDVGHRLQAVSEVSSLFKEAYRASVTKLNEQLDWQAIQQRQLQATRRLTQGIQFLLKQAKVNVIVGEASLKDEYTVQVNTQEGSKDLTCDGIILATGSNAFIPAPFDTIQDSIYDNSNFFSMPALPKKLALIGGGVIGCEMADLMNALGVEVHLLEMQPRILPQESEEISKQLTQEFTKRGIQIHAQVTTQQVKRQNDSFGLLLSTGETLEVDAILVAVGRSVDLTNLHLENIGVSWNRKGVKVDPVTLQLKDNIYAVGDMNGLLQLAHAASRQGEVAASNLCGKQAKYDGNIIPRVIYTNPEIASVGITQTSSVSGTSINVHKSFYLANGRAVAQTQTKGMVELFVDASSQKLVGGSIVGAHATELIHIIAIALTANLSLEQIHSAVFAHPTFAEAIAEATTK